MYRKDDFPCLKIHFNLSSATEQDLKSMQLPEKLY